MSHKGVEYTLTKSETPGFWNWHFRIGDLVRSGKTEASLALLAVRRVELRIDRELKPRRANWRPDWVRERTLPGASPLLCRRLTGA